MKEEQRKIPQHIAIILDGNGRWAKKRFLPRNMGHREGGKRVEELCENAYHMGVRYLSIYAFSTENWTRPQDEVDALMKILRNYLSDSIKQSMKNNMRVRILGDKSTLPSDIQRDIQKLEEATRENTGLNFQIAINYGGRDEILRAVKNIIEDAIKEKLSAEELSEELFSSYLDTKDIPDPDFLIRTSGEQRLSNFLLWQSAYAEFYFPEILWPDFDKKALEQAILEYTNRDRRFGGVKEA